MADKIPTLRERLDRLLEHKPTRTPATPAPAITAAPMPGFRFGLGARVIDLVSGGRGIVRAAYYSARAFGPVYELTTDQQVPAVRLERELEPDGPQTAPPAAPTTR